MAHALPTFATFGEMLRYLRRQARLTQRELAIAVGYSESMISRLEHGDRPPDVATIHALFVPALRLERQPETVARLIELANTARGGAAHGSVQKPAHGSRRSYLPQRLPVRLTSFVGRNEDLRTVTRLLTDRRLLTLTGPGGCGKTSLAVEACRQFAEPELAAGENGAATNAPQFENDLAFDEVCLVELFPISDPDLLAPTVLAALGMEGSQEQPALETLLSAVANRCLLLILDNCEHLAEHVAAFVRILLQGCPNLRIIVTSRERLNIVAETVYTVAPLRCPDQHRLPDLAGMLEYPALQLFVERCQALAPDFRLTSENAGVVAEICALLDGIPLALELGAAATATFSVQDIAHRLHTQRLPLSPAFRAVDTRHASIDDTVAWSYQLLSPAEQRLLALLSVFVGGWTLAALQQVCADQPGSTAILHQLVNKSLVSVAHAASAAGQTRYYLLRAVREYAAAQLAGSGEDESARARHFDYFSVIGARLGDEVLGPRHSEAMASLDADHANIRASLTHGRRKEELAEPYVRLAAALTYYWRRRGYVAESSAWLSELPAGKYGLSLATNALAHTAVLYEMSDEPYCYSRGLQNNDALLRLAAEADALVQSCLGQGEKYAAARLMLAVASLQDDGSNAAAREDYVRRALSAFEELGDVRGAALAANLLTRILLTQGSLDAASRIQEQIVTTLEQNRMSWCLCEAYWLQQQLAQLQFGPPEALRILQRIAKIAEGEEFVAVIHDVYFVLEHLDASMAATMAEQLLARQRQRRPSTMLCLALHQLGRMYLNAGRYREAQEVLDEALQLYPRLNTSLREPPGPQWSLIDRGEVARLQGEAELAVACFDESIRLFRATPFPYLSVGPLLFLGQVHFEQGDIGAALVDFRFCLRLSLQDPKDWTGNIFNCLAGIAEIARMRGRRMAAAKLYAKAAMMESAWSAAGHYSQPHVTAFYERLMAAVPQFRQDSAFEAAWHEGEGLSLGEAVQVALAW